MRRLNKNWKRPIAPLCQVCGKEVDLVAVHGGDEWGLCWDEWCENHSTGVDAYDASIEWPFAEDYADLSDWEELGIRVE